MKPINRKEKFLNAILTGNTEGLPVPITREETYLDEIAKKSGGGGTSNYNDLNNKPRMNGVTLAGNKSTEDLIPIGSGLRFNSNGELEATGGGGVNYSTDEQIIGTWIDGKPLYQKTVVIESPTNNARNQISGFDFLNTHNLVDMINASALSVKQGQRIVTHFVDSTSYFQINVGGDGTSLYISWGSTAYGTFTNLIVTIQYTKTTD